MVLSWLRFAWPFGSGNRSSAPVAIDLSRLGARDLADLNLSPDLRARLDLQRCREAGGGRW